MTLHLSVIIPAYNEAGRIGRTLVKLAEYLQEEPFDAEVLVIDNASTDGTPDAAAACRARFHTLRVLSEPRRGKGAAVRAGMLAATGAVRMMCDADMSMSLADMPRFLRAGTGGIDIVAGSRELAESVVTSPLTRKLAGRTFNGLARVVLGLSSRDSQCGFKSFSAAAAQAVFSRSRIDGYGFDVEVLTLARRLGYSVEWVPVHWVHDDDSRVRVVRDGIAMAGEMLRVRLNLWRGVYRLERG